MARDRKPSPDANWRAWVERAERSGDRADAARRAVFLRGLARNHPDLKGLSADQVEAFARRLDAVANGA